MVQIKHWQDSVNAVLGVWLVLSPWALGFQSETTPMANAVIVGAALIAAALGAMLVPRAWEEWTELVLGLWMIVAPWVLGFAAMREAMLASTITGVVVAALALWTLATDPEWGGWWRREAH